MYLTDLADACRASGLRVVETDGWQRRGHAPFAGVATIVCHHTAGPAAGNMPSLGVVTNGRPGLDGPLCNLALGRDGTVYVVAAGVAWHAGAVTQTTFDNWHAIGIEAEATGVDEWPPEQMRAYVALCRALCDHYQVPVARVLGHKEVCSPPGRKIDPNFNMSRFRQLVAAYTAKPPQEDDMPEPKDVWNADVIPVPKGRLSDANREKNPTFQADNALGEAWAYARRAALAAEACQDAMKKMADLLDKLAPGVSAAVRKAVEESVNANLRIEISNEE